MKEPQTPQHIALHLAKYAGELAAIAEHWDHGTPEKTRKAQRLAKEFMGRGEAIKWCGEEAERMLKAMVA